MEMSWEYIAGFFDGEGYFGLTYYDNSKYPSCKPTSKGYRIRIDVCQKTTARLVMEKISEFLWKKEIKHSLYDAKGWHGGTPMTHIVIARKRCVKELLNSLLPLLIVKQEAAQKLMDFCTNPKGPII